MIHSLRELIMDIEHNQAYFISLKEKKAKKIALNLLKHDFTIETIMKVTELSRVQIELLQKEIDANETK
jgi:hypothetical protein